MNRIPVDVPALGDIRFVSSETRKDNEGRPVLRDGVPVQRTCLLVKPINGRPEVLQVDVTRVEPIRLGENAKVQVSNLTARPWAIDGRDGVSFAADDISSPGVSGGDAK